MSDVFDALGPLYAKLGLATAADLITARKAAAKAGFKVFKKEHLAGALRGALGLQVSEDVAPVFTAMREADPTLDPQLVSREAALLLGAVLSAEMAKRTALGGLSALGLLTASFGGMRQSQVWPELINDADRCLANMQLAGVGRPTDRVAAKRPAELTTALDAISLLPSSHGQTLAGEPAKTAMKAMADYADSAHAAAASQANAVLAYARRLEEELHTYWWVVGGWSDELRKPFSSLRLPEAAIRAGIELAAKTTLPLGLFAAPALLDRQLRHGRSGRLTNMALAEAASTIEATWRKQFEPAAAHGDLLPATLALHLSAESNDAEDWRARFKRTTGLAANVPLSPLDLALQIHREALLARALRRAA